MRLRLLLLALIVPCLLVAGKDKDKDASKEFAPKDGGFVVSMPGTPLERKEEDLKTPSGPIELHIYEVERKKEETAYLVIFCELPETVFKNSTDEKRLDYARKRAVNTSKGKLKSDKKIKVGDLPGRELQFEVEGKGVVRQRLFVVKDKLIQLLVAGPKEKVLSKDADKFLVSFKLKS
jgi:hypothetical protein